MSGRQKVLCATEQAVMTDRNADYDPPEDNFRRIADLWNVYLEGKTEVTPYDTAIMMVLVKVALGMSTVLPTGVVQRPSAPTFRPSDTATS